MMRRFDVRTFLMIVGAALVGAAWAIYNRSIVGFPYDEAELRPLVWVIFATPFAMFWGWFFARPAERGWAAFVSFCVYFFSPFVAQRYESCTVVSGSFNLVDCFAATAQAQELAGNNGHRIYFGSIVVIHVLIALIIATQRAMRPRNTTPAEQPAHVVSEPAS